MPWATTQPLIVGTQGGGLANFSPNLDLPYTGPTSTLVAPTQFQHGTGATFGIAFLSDLEVYLFLTAAQGDTRSNVLQAPKVTTFNGAAGDHLQQHRPVLCRRRSPRSSAPVRWPTRRRSAVSPTA